MVAGILHDVIEDCVRDGYTRDMLESRVADKFGTNVLSTVLAVTSRKYDDDGTEMSSEERKDDYLARLSNANARARWVCAADKVHNASTSSRTSSAPTIRKRSGGVSAQVERRHSLVPPRARSATRRRIRCADHARARRCRARSGRVGTGRSELRHNPLGAETARRAARRATHRPNLLTAGESLGYRERFARRVATRNVLLENLEKFRRRSPTAKRRRRVSRRRRQAPSVPRMFPAARSQCSRASIRPGR